MKIKIWYYNFWNGFQLLKRSFIQILEEVGYEFVLDEKNPDVVFIGPVDKITYNGPAIKIGYVTENMKYYRNIPTKIKENYFDMVTGCISSDESKNFVKHGSVIRQAQDRHVREQQICKKKVDVLMILFLKNIKDLKFCTMIFEHDNCNNRKPIFDLLSKIGFIECPEILIIMFLDLMRVLGQLGPAKKK